MSQPGIIQEQGFIAGNGLGFNPITEAEKKALEDQKREENQKKK